MIREFLSNWLELRQRAWPARFIAMIQFSRVENIQSAPTGQRVSLGGDLDFKQGRRVQVRNLPDLLHRESGRLQAAQRIHVGWRKRIIRAKYDAVALNLLLEVAQCCRIVQYGVVMHPAQIGRGEVV